MLQSEQGNKLTEHNDIRIKLMFSLHHYVCDMYVILSLVGTKLYFED